MQLVFEDDLEQLGTYFKSLQMEDLNDVLGRVLSEMRLRETEEMRQDVITKSKSLRLKFPLKRQDDKP